MGPGKKRRGGRSAGRGDGARAGDPDGRWSASRPAVWAALGAAVSLLLALAAFDPYLFSGGDNAHYYALAKALASGRGYVDLVAPGAPPHVQYPPGFPALLAPLHALSGGSLVAMKSVAWLAAAGLLAGLWLLARRDPAVAAWATAAAIWTVGLYPATQTYAHRLLSDLPYIAVVTLALAVLQGATADEDDPDRLDRAWFGGCALAVCAFYIRTVGVTLLAAIGVWALLTRRWKRAATSTAIAAAGVLPWWLWIRRAPDRSGDYIEQLAATSPIGGGGRDWGRLFERVQETVVEYATFQFPGLFWPTDPPPIGARALGLLVGGALVAWGVARAFRSRGIAPWDLYVAATVAILPLWPWLGERYMLTLAPFLWLYLLVGLDDASRRLVGGPVAGGITVGALSALLLIAQVRDLPDQWERTRGWLAGDTLAGYDPFWEDYFSAARWIGENTPEDAVVLARKPTLAWYWSGRTAVAWPFWREPEGKWRYIREMAVTHILIEPTTARNLVGVLSEHEDLLSMPFHRAGTEVAVFTLAPDPATPGAVESTPP